MRSSREEGRATVRISAGAAKGRKIGSRRLFVKSSSGEELRPTSAKVREALFDIIRERVRGCTFVDLYAGTGTVGIEALSRGAEMAVFVEPNDLRVKTIKQVASEFGFKDRAEVVRGKAYEFIKKASAKGLSFDIFFLDPPYQSEELMKVLPLIGDGTLLRQKGIVIVEHFFKRELPEVVGRLKLTKHYRYGDTVLTLYRKEI